ncbi:MAG: GNAT family N-acetyltransferase [Kiritimatiellales bacterium]|nr:GNAT family N-acetyltransferase [Kiritimatiellales bacterium]
MELVDPDLQYKESFMSSLEEKDLPGAEGFGMIGENFKNLGSPKTLEEYIQIRKDHSQGKNLRKDWVSASTFWLINEKCFIGEVTIRHELTEHLRNVGGHIGYWIRPSERQKGYGKIILKLALEKAKELGINKVLVTCDEMNIGSRKIIEANGGVLDRIKDSEDEDRDRTMYWIINIGS